MLDNDSHHCLTMDEIEMLNFIDSIGRMELFDELHEMQRDKSTEKYPRYLKAVMVSLVEQGYDERWVDTKFKEALEERYLHEDNM